MEKEEILKMFQEMDKEWEKDSRVIRLINDQIELEKEHKRKLHKLISHTIDFYESRMKKAKEWENKLLFDEEINDLNGNLFINGYHIEALCEYFENWGTLREYLETQAEER